MFDEQNFKSGLPYALSATGLPVTQLVIEAASKESGIPDQDLSSWISGVEIPDDMIPQVAMLFNLPTWILKPNFEEVLHLKSGGMVPSNNIYSGDDLNGYWGNIGLRAPGMKHSTWMSCSDLTADGFYRDVVNGSAKVARLDGMGLFSYIVCPDNMLSMSALAEACDRVEGDWDISSMDPVEGLPVALVSLLAEGIYDNLALENLSGDFRKSFDQVIEGCGGQEVVEESLSKVTVFFVDGTVKDYALGYKDEDFQNSVARIDYGMYEEVKAYEDEVDEANYYQPTRIVLRDSDDALSVIPLKNVAMIRFPSTFTDPGELL